MTETLFTFRLSRKVTLRPTFLEMERTKVEFRTEVCKARSRFHARVLLAKTFGGSGWRVPMEPLKAEEAGA